MSGIRVLVGTRKGGFVLTSDAKRKDWKVDGPHFAGWEIYHVKGSPVDPDRIYASQTSAWVGQIIQRSSDGGKTWETPRCLNRKMAENRGTNCPVCANTIPARSGSPARAECVCTRS